MASFPRGGAGAGLEHVQLEEPSMKLHWSPRSPYVRKVMVALHEVGLSDRVETVRTVVAVTQPNAVLQRDNPLSKIPTLVLDDGSALYDSRVICEYFDTLHAGPPLIPTVGVERWTALRRQALADGLLDLLLVWRQELSRPAEQRSHAHLTAYDNKVTAALHILENEVGSLRTTVFGIAHIAIGCTLSYADFRFPELGWRSGRPKLEAWHRDFEARPTVRATAIEDDS
jgi:glutathione S-transferase